MGKELEKSRRGSLLRRLARRLLGRWPRGNPRPFCEDLSLAVPFPPSQQSDWRPRVAVMIHVFFADLATEFRGYLENIDGPCDLLITTDTVDKKAQIARAFATWEAGSVTIRLVPNRGRDIAPKLIAFIDEYARYDLVLFLHSKKSTTSPFGDPWRSQILASLCGSRDIVRSVSALFDQDKKLGIVQPRNFDGVRPFMAWREGTAASALPITKKLDLNLNLWGDVDYPAGSMFWARPGALQPLFDCDFTIDDFLTEDGQIGGTLAHAVEILFLLVCERAGYSWCKVAAPEEFEQTETIIHVDDYQSIEAARGKVDFRVSTTMLRSSGSLRRAPAIHSA